MRRCLPSVPTCVGGDGQVAEAQALVQKKGRGHTWEAEKSLRKLQVGRWAGKRGLCVGRQTGKGGGRQ